MGSEMCIRDRHHRLHVYIFMHHSTKCLQLYPCRAHHRLFISLCTTAQTVYNCTHADHTTDCLYLYAPQHKLSVIVPMQTTPQTACLYLYAPQHKLSTIVPMQTTPQSVYIFMHHSTNCLQLYPCRPHHRLFISLCTTAQTVCNCTHAHTTDFISLCTTAQTVYNCTHAHTTDCLYLYAPQHKLSTIVPMQTTPQTV